MLVKIKNVRLAFPALFKPQAIGDGEPAYNARFIIDPDHKQIAEIEKAMKTVAAEKWTGNDKNDQPKWLSIYKKLEKDGLLCFSREEYVNKDGVPYAGFEDMFHIGARNMTKPKVVDANPDVDLTEKDGRPYAGCYVNAHLDIWAQDNAFGRRINASLSGVQFFKDGDAFTGGRPSKNSDFDDVSDTGEEPEDEPEEL